MEKQKNALFSKLKKGDILGERHFYTVEEINFPAVILKNEQGTKVSFDWSYIENCMMSAEQFEDEINMSRTDAIAILIENAYTPTTVLFNKKVKPKGIRELILEIRSTAPDINEFEKRLTDLIHKCTVGEERLIVGYHTGNLIESGHLYFQDLQKMEEQKRLREVDTRTIQWFILKGTKYNIKKV